MATDTKLRLHTNTSKARLCYGSENWIINKRDTPKLEAAQMRFFRSLVGLKRLDRQRNPDIRNRLKVHGIVEGTKLYQKKWLDHLKRMDRSFQYQPRGRWDMGRLKQRCRDQEHLEF
jgi:hypothetical protein